MVFVLVFTPVVDGEPELAEVRGAEIVFVGEVYAGLVLICAGSVTPPETVVGVVAMIFVYLS